MEHDGSGCGVVEAPLGSVSVVGIAATTTGSSSSSSFIRCDVIVIVFTRQLAHSCICRCRSTWRVFSGLISIVSRTVTDIATATTTIATVTDTGIGIGSGIDIGIAMTIVTAHTAKISFDRVCTHSHSDCSFDLTACCSALLE